MTLCPVAALEQARGGPLLRPTRGDDEHGVVARDRPGDRAVVHPVEQHTEELGLPRDRLESNMRSERVREVVQQSYEIAQALGLSGTPSYVVGDAVEFGAVGFDQLMARVNEARCGELTC